MTTPLRPANERADGKPWVPWAKGSEYLAALPGHRERIELCGWYDRYKQSLILTLTQYDESMNAYVPCYAQLTLIDAGPFLAEGEVRSLADMFVETILCEWDLQAPPT